MEKRIGIVEVADEENSDSKNQNLAEIMSAVEEMFPELDPQAVHAWFRRLTNEHRRRLRLSLN